MRYSTTTVVMAALSIAEVVVAGPTHAHLHRHRDVHAKKDVDWAALDWDNMGIDWSKAWEEGQHKSTSAPAPVATTSAVKPAVLAEVPATTTAPVVVSTPSPTKAAASSSSSTSSSASASSSSSSDLGDVVATLWNDLVGLANKFTSFGTAATGGGSEVAAIGNIGSPQGSNMLLVDSASGYPFTNTFKNTQKVSITVVLWNKAYSTDGTVAKADPNLGSCVAPKTPTLTFALAPGASQVVAFQDGTLMSWSQAVDKTTLSGAFDTTWGEASFKTAANGASGYDVSAIVNSAGNHYWMSISADETSCISDPTQNYWTTSDGNPENPIPIGSSDGSCYVPGDKATLTTEMGGDF